MISFAFCLPTPSGVFGLSLILSEDTPVYSLHRLFDRKPEMRYCMVRPSKKMAFVLISRGARQAICGCTH